VKSGAFAERVPKRLILVDGKERSRLMIRYSVGVRAVRTVELKKVDLDYFEEEEAQPSRAPAPNLSRTKVGTGVRRESPGMRSRGGTRTAG